jgi:hypothetical protein
MVAAVICRWYSFAAPDIILVSRALPASNRLNEGEGRVFRWESRPFRFTSLPLVLKTRPSVADSPGPSTLQPDEPRMADS